MTGLLGPALLGALAWGVARVATSGPPLASPPEPLLPLRDFPTPLLVPEMHAVASPSMTSLSFARLPAVRVWNMNNHDEAVLRLYRIDGSIDPDALTALNRLLGDVNKPDAPEYTEMDPRVVQLMFRAAYHFRAPQIVVISGYRSPRKRHEGFHGRGLAIDFQLPNVRLTALAAYLQGLPKVGVGLYTNPRTQWIHLDSRARSYHWADASAPGEPGGAWPIGDSSRRTRQDRAYAAAGDWPEGTVVKPSVVQARVCRLVSTPREADEP